MTDPDIQRQRSTLLSVLFSAIGGAAFLFFLFLICSGAAVYVLATIGGVVILGYVHYLLWGHSLNQEVAGEREEEQTQGELPAPDWDWEEPYRHGRL